MKHSDFYFGEYLIISEDKAKELRVKNRTAEESRLLKIRLLFMNNFASINEYHMFNSVLDMRDPDVRGMFRVFLDKTDDLFNR